LVDLDVLTALDALQWLRTADEVTRRFDISASSVSRQSRKCLEIFDVQLLRTHGEWNVVGDPSLLLLERRVHQAARWLGRRSLRLEATYWSGPLLCSPPPNHWILGLSNIVGISRNFQLVRDRIVDACVVGLPDIPDGGDPDLAVKTLSSMPVFFVACPDHPLVSRSHLSYEDIAEYPTLALPEGSYPKVEKSLRSIGLWNDVVRMSRYRREVWEGRTEAELTIGYGTVLSREVSGGPSVRLPLELPLASGEAIVVRKEYLDHPKFTALCDFVLSRLLPFSLRYPEIQLLESPAGGWGGHA
jgi:DNA-binding transcriptional LysR family regulator